MHRKLMAACAEPYRALFPLGVLGAVFGLGVWIPYALAPEAFGYPGQAHAVLQIQGFLLCFVFGFLGTMLPKVLGVAPLGPAQFLVFPVGLVGLMAATLLNAPLGAQWIHFVLLANFVIFMLRRWPQRRGNPPSFFVFIAAALLSDIAGTALRLASLTVWTGPGGPQAYRLGALLQYQAFPLLLVLGVGGFLLPKLFAGQHIDPARLAPSRAGTGGLLVAGALFLAGYVVEAALPVFPLAIRLGAALRGGVWIWFLIAQLRLHRVPGGLPPYLAGARWALWSMGLGLALPAALPRYLLAWEHLVFITGILWLTLSVASRVAAAHGGRIAALHEGRKTTLALGWLLALAALTRASTEIWTGGRTLHLALAAGLALVGLGLWTGRYGALFFRMPA